MGIFFRIVIAILYAAHIYVGKWMRQIDKLMAFHKKSVVSKIVHCSQAFYASEHYSNQNHPC